MSAIVPPPASLAATPSSAGIHGADQVGAVAGTENRAVRWNRLGCCSLQAKAAVADERGPILGTPWYIASNIERAAGEERRRVLVGEHEGGLGGQAVLVAAAS